MARCASARVSIKNLKGKHAVGTLDLDPGENGMMRERANGHLGIVGCLHRIHGKEGRRNRGPGFPGTPGNWLRLTENRSPKS
jgi:hypothetical protein